MTPNRTFPPFWLSMAQRVSVASRRAPVVLLNSRTSDSPLATSVLISSRVINAFPQVSSFMVIRRFNLQKTAKDLQSAQSEDRKACSDQARQRRKIITCFQDYSPAVRGRCLFLHHEKTFHGTAPPSRTPPKNTGADSAREEHAANLEPSPPRKISYTRLSRCRERLFRRARIPNP